MGNYNLTEKKPKEAAYRMLIRAELIDALYEKIIQKIVVQRKYKDPDSSSNQLAEDLDTNTRYVSAVVNVRFNMNYTSLVNEYRIKDACYLLADKRHAERNMEEVSVMVGFANRQSFYAAFYKIMGITPRAYRMKHLKRVKPTTVKEKHKEAS